MGKGSTETQTTALSEEDAASIRAGRDAGAATAAAANAGPWAQGLDPYTHQAGQQYDDIYGQYGGFGDVFSDLLRQSSDIGMQTGLQGLESYMNPMLGSYFAGMDPMYQNAYAQAGQTADQQATMQGAFGGSRAGIAEGQARGDVQIAQLADYGSHQYQAARDAAGMLMDDRSRIGGYQNLYAGMGLNALAGQQDVTRNQAIMGDYRRNVAQQQAQDEYMRRAAAQQGIQAGHGENISTSVTSEKEGDLLGDVLSVGGMAAGALIPGAGGLLGMLGGGGGGGPNVTSQMAAATQPQNVMGPTINPQQFTDWVDPLRRP
jgi:hypothetical protein